MAIEFGEHIGSFGGVNWGEFCDRFKDISRVVAVCKNGLLRSRVANEVFEARGQGVGYLGLSYLELGILVTNGALDKGTLSLAVIFFDPVIAVENKESYVLGLLLERFRIRAIRYGLSEEENYRFD